MDKQRIVSRASSPALYDIVVIGGGIIGLATARELIRRSAGSVAVIEREKTVGRHQTGHNSGVIHASLYYRPSSLKAELCLKGMKMSYEYMQAYQIPYRKVGKLVIAKSHDEIPALKQLFGNAVSNEVPHVRYIDDSDGICEIEPEATGVAAIHSPETGITDWAQVAFSLEKNIIASGGEVLTRHNVVGIADGGDRVVVATEVSAEGEKSKNKSTFEARRIVACAGAYADRVAALTGGAHEPQIVPVRGEYLVIPANCSLARRIRGNIYPVPVAGIPFLGVHFTPTLSGDVILGPNAVLALSRDGQSGSRFSDICAADVAQLALYSGFWRLVARHGMYGAGEALRSAWPGAAVRRAARYVPALQPSDVRRGGRTLAGVRAQAVGLRGELVDDFVFERSVGGKVLHTRNAPSPGATSALAIAEIIADYVEQS